MSTSFASQLHPAPQVFQLASGLLRVSSDSAQARNLWTDFSRKYCLTQSSTTNVRDLMGYLELYGETSPPLPPDVPAEEIEHGIYRADGKLLWLEMAGSVILISQSIVKIWFGSADHEAAEMVIAYAVSAVIRRSGLFELHAAGLVEPATKQGVLIIGDSGCGKSTLTMRLAGSGWQYLSDDLLLLQKQQTKIQSWGWRRVFALTSETMQFCAPKNLQFPNTASAEKQYLDPDILFPKRAAASCFPAALFFPQITYESKTHIEPISPSNAMMNLLRQSWWLCYDPLAAHQHTHVLTQLTHQCQSFRVFAGHDLLMAPSLANELFRAALS